MFWPIGVHDNPAGRPCHLSLGIAVTSPRVSLLPPPGLFSTGSLSEITSLLCSKASRGSHVTQKKSQKLVSDVPGPHHLAPIPLWYNFLTSLRLLSPFHHMASLKPPSMLQPWDLCMCCYSPSSFLPGMCLACPSLPAGSYSKPSS